MKRRKIGVKTCLLTTFFFLLLSGCGPKPGEIEVLENKDTSYNKFSLQRMDTYKKIYAVDWITDNLFLDSRFRLYNVKTNKAHFLVHDRNAREALVSPNKKYLFYRISKFNQAGNYYILNLQTKKKIVLPIKEQVWEPSWVNNETILFLTNQGDAYYVNTSGEVTKINHSFQATGDGVEDQIFELIQVGEQFFYLDGYKLMVWSRNTNQTKHLMDNIVDLVLSPDQTKLAFIKQVPKDPRDYDKEGFIGYEVLMVMDVKGSRQKVVAQGDSILGLNWSGDSKKLSYLISKSSATNQSELYIADIIGGDITLLATNIGPYYKQMEWNPSGNGLLVNSLFYDADEPHPVLYILHLKSNDKSFQRY
ncbi:hypothetical protein MK805_13590 [Shimazuella sp. AN120528]|uniref:hypothetical protein n=1 Tax=Shimazuella soli TaxID=1892854 RepID=UPI001F103B91|nr:hypothetical protein [Shimazuella soli]MCH5585974.1 hypothetical protein [Shimazuella soli]